MNVDDHDSIAPRDAADAAFSRALHSTPAPEGLDARLLAAMRAARPAIEPPPELESRVLAAVRAAAAPAKPKMSRRRVLLWSASAAAAAVAVGTGISRWHARQWRPLSLDGLTEELAEISNGFIWLSLRTELKTEIAAWMKKERAPHAAAFPAKLDALPRKGCRLYHIAGHEVSLECFVLGGSVLHLFTTPAAGLTAAPPDGAAPQVSEAHGHTIAAWTRGPQTLVLLCHESPATLQPLLA